MTDGYRDPISSVSEAEQTAAHAPTTTDTGAAQVASVVARGGDPVDLVNAILLRAVEDRASDVHLERTPEGLRVRNRVDGVLYDVQEIDGDVAATLTSRIKILAEMDVAERRVPQDGRFTHEIGRRIIDIRGVTLPTIHGESVVLRILDKALGLPGLDDLGLLEYPRRRYEHAIASGWGMALVTGPTGSGKSTTLYATLAELNQPGRNIVTIEDPIEHRIPGLKQIQVNPKAGLTFASALRSILRADPDILLVGEIRDAETARLATEAALTGHLVLTTLHTSDAASTLQRLVEMGIEPYMVVTTVNCVVAQRLVRRLCPQCREAYRPTGPELQSLGWPADLTEADPYPKLHRPGQGCLACGGTGYRGRFAIFEIMPLSGSLRQLILDRASNDEIAAQAELEGMSTMREDGLRKVALGETSIDELLRIAS